MLIRKYNLEDFEPMGDCRWQLLYPWKDVVDTPFWSGWTHLAPGQETKRHQHHELETYFIVKGRGAMSVRERTVEVGPGDAIYMPPFNDHVLKNTSEDEDVLFLSVFWEDMQALSPLADQAAAEASRPVVVVACPSAADPSSLAHLAGPALGADAHARFLRLRGGAARMAADGGLLGAEVAADLASPTAAAPDRAAALQRLVRALHSAGKLTVESVPVLVCAPCGRTLDEAEARGRCPCCNAETAAPVCSACGRPVAAAELAGALCASCGAAPERHQSPRLVFPLPALAAALREHYLTAAMSPHLHALCEHLVADGLPRVAISREAAAGIPLPIPGIEGQTVAAGLEPLAALLAAGDDAWAESWRAAGAAALPFFELGQWFHWGVLYPALLLAAGDGFQPPQALLASEVLHGAAAPASELLARVPADALRFHLAATRPETGETVFSASDLERTWRDELVAGWQAWLADLGACLTAEHGGRVPSTGLWTPAQRHFYQQLLGFVRDAGRAFAAETFSLGEASRALRELVWTARRFAAAEAHWVGVPNRRDERRTSLALGLTAAKALALLAAPILPGFAARLAAELGYEAAELRWEEVPSWVPAGREIAHLGGPYFEV